MCVSGGGVQHVVIYVNIKPRSGIDWRIKSTQSYVWCSATIIIYNCPLNLWKLVRKHFDYCVPNRMLALVINNVAPIIRSSSSYSHSFKLTCCSLCYSYGLRKEHVRFYGLHCIELILISCWQVGNSINSSKTCTERCANWDMGRIPMRWEA